MSVPTIVVSPSPIPSSIQIATPFSYTFVNSGIYDPGTITRSPEYQGTVTITTTTPYTPNNTNLSFDSSFDQTAQGLEYPLAGLQIGDAFLSRLPYPAGTNTTIQFMSMQVVLKQNGIGDQTMGFNDPFTESFYSYNPGGYLKVTVTAIDLEAYGVQLFHELFANSNDAEPILTNFYTTNVPLAFFMSFIAAAGDGEIVDMDVTAPDIVIAVPPSYPYLHASVPQGSPIIPFLSGSGTTQVTFASTTGFQTDETSITLDIVQVVSDVIIGTTSYTFDVPTLSITTTPTLTDPLSLVTYQPFAYTYSIPSDIVNVVLQVNSSTSPSLLPYISDDASTFSSTIGLTSAGNTKIKIDAILNGNSALASRTTNIVTSATGVIVTPSIPTGSLNLYKYEPFSYVFTSNPLSQSITLQFTGSSSELQAFCSLSDDGQSVTFAGTFAASYSATLSLVIDIVSAGAVVGSTTILIAVGPGRFFPPSANQNYQLYQYENISNTFGSNPVFSTVTPIDTIFTTPALPTGLSFGTVTLGNDFYLQGMPVLQSAQNTYKVIGSNSSNGKIVTTTVSMKVNPQLVRMTPSLVTLSGLTVGTSIDPITFTAIQPVTIYANTFRYTWSGLPDGFSFQFPNGSNFPDQGSPTDSALSIVLVGAPTLAFANSMAVSGGNLYQTRLSGFQTDQTGKQTTGAALINFSFAETVLISVSNPVDLYQTKPLGGGDVVITAGSFFPTSQIAGITSSVLPPGLSLVQYTSPNVYHLVGTPTVVDTSSFYTFTAINYNSLARSTKVQLPIYPDIVTFVSPSPASGSSIQLIVSRPIISDYPSSIVFQATSTSSATPIVYSSSLDLSIYGLVLNATTGVLSGLATTPLSQTSVTITATDSLGTIGTTSIQLTILADVFTWPTYTPVYFQNREITPFTIVMTSTLSGRSIQSYSSADLPTGVFINPSGTLSGAPSVFVSGTQTFHITATTGYSTQSHEYSYTMIKDQLLTLEIGGATPVPSTVFSNVLFETIQYSTNTIVQPTYSITNLLPLQSAPLPVINISSNGIMTADFTNGVASNYTASLTTSYGTATGTSPIIFAFTPITTPIITAAYWKPYNPTSPAETSSNGGYIASANTYVFPGPVTQTWNNKIPITSYYNGGSSQQYLVTKPEISRCGDYYVAGGSDGGNGVWLGQFYSISNSNSLVASNISWTVDNSVERGAHPAIANDSVSKWVVLSLPNTQPQSNITGVWTRTGFAAGSWSLVTRITTTVPTLEYMSPNFVLGNSGLGAIVDICNSNIGTYNCNANRVQYANSSSLGTWTTSATLPGFSNILRFSKSNSTLVAIGSGAPAGVFPLAYSTDSASNWTTVTSLSILTGGNVVLNDILYANNKWVLCGLNSNLASFIAYSSDLSNWSFYMKPDIISNSITSNVSWDAIGFNRNAWTIAGSISNNSNTCISYILSIDAGTWPDQSYSVASETLFSNYNPGIDSIPITKVSRIVSDVQKIGASTGVVTIPNSGSLTFSKPTTSKFTLFQYVPYSIDVQAIGTSDFIYYFARGVPIGFSFTPDDTGIAAVLSVISPSNTSQSLTIYANTLSGYLTNTTISFSTLLPFFVNPQSGAGAYTALLRNEVEANASQNARDNKVFPQEDPLAGPYMGPRAPDVVTPDDCFLKLCKKPCPTCRS